MTNDESQLEEAKNFLEEIRELIKDDKTYITILEKLVIDNFTKSKASRKEKILLLEKIIPAIDNVSMALENTNKRNKHLSKELSKHRQGKKVLQDNLELYKEIIQTDKDRMASGEDSNYSKSTEKVATKHHFSELREHRLYRSFNFWFNNPKNKKLLSKLLH